MHVLSVLQHHYEPEVHTNHHFEQRMSKGKTPRKSRFWLFTLNNYIEDERTQMHIEFSNPEEVSYAVCGFEVGKEMETPHIQGYVEFRRSLSMAAIKQDFPFLARAHLEIRRGNRQQAITYSKKDGDFCEFGDISNATTNNQKLTNQEIKDIATTQGIRAIVNDPRYSAHAIRTARLVLEQCEPERNEKEPIFCVWYYGRTGVGKSRRARWEADDEFGRDNVYRKAESSKWWNGYDRHPAIIIDDFRDSWWAFTEMLALLDRHPRTVEFKGGTRQWVPKKIWITSSMSPRKMYSGVGEDLMQLIRRCKVIEEMTLEWLPPNTESQEV